jgi:hypothetical protein
MNYTPNYTNPTIDEYMELLNWKARLVQEIEIHEKRKNFGEVAALKREKQKVTIRRKCMKAALKQKEKRQVLPTLAV